MDFFDKYGFVSDNRDADGDKENKILFSIEWLLLLLYPRVDSLSKVESVRTLKDIAYTLTDGKKWYPLPDHTKLVEEGFSRDNMIALTSLGMLARDEELSKAGLKHLFDKPYLQPQDMIYFAICANNAVGWLFFPVLFISMFIACFSLSQTRGGKLDTDGRLLSFVRCLSNTESKAFRMMWKVLNWISKIRLAKYLKLNPSEMPSDLCTDEIKNNLDKYHWRILFRMYFQDANHPINQWFKYKNIEV